MHMASQNMEPIFIHSLFRSGSTFIYYAVKRAGRFHAYHEPFHELIGSLPDHWDEMVGRTEQLKNLLRHDFLDSGYFEEYADLLPIIEQKFHPDVSFALFFLDVADDSKVLKSYVDCLVDGSKRQSVFQCTRTIGRLRWLKKNYVSKNLFLLRNPWDQWFSYKVDFYIAATPQIIYSQERLPKALQGVAIANEFVQLKGHNIAEMLNHGLTHPVEPSVDYALFFGLWLYSYLEAYAECNLVLDMDMLSQSEVKRTEAKENLAEIGLGHINLRDCDLHRTIFKSKELGFYQKIEEQVIAIFRQNGYSETALEPVQHYLSSQRGVSFVEYTTSDGNFKSTIEDASRARAMLISNDQDRTRLVNRLRQDVDNATNELSELKNKLGEKEHRIEFLSAELAAREEQLNEILVSKTWKAALLLRRVRVLIAPPNSLRSRILRWSARAVLAPTWNLRTRARFKEDATLVRSSGLFDEDWYLKNNPDVAQSKTDPLLHFLHTGGVEGRDPGPNFSSNWYLKNYADIRGFGINPLVHYLRYGKNEGRLALPDLTGHAALSGSEWQMEQVPGSTSDRLTVFTIASRNFTAYAKTLFELGETISFRCRNVPFPL